MNIVLKLKNSIFFKKYIWLWAIIVIVLIRVICLLLALSDVPYTGAVEKGIAWWSFHGGDEDFYFRSAKSILSWEFLRGAPSIGFSFFLAPFVYFFNAENVSDISYIIVIIFSIFFYTAATVLVYLISRKVLINKLKSIIISLVFLFYPYFFYYVTNLILHSSATLANFPISRFKQLMFMVFLSDPLSTVLTLLSLYILLKIISSSGNNYYLALLLGVIMAISVMTRWQNLIILISFVLLLVFFRKIKSLALFIAGGLPFAFLQLYINYQANGSIFKTVFKLKKGDNLDIPMVSFEYPLRLIKYPLEYEPLILIPIILFIIIIFLGAWHLIKVNRIYGITLVFYSIFFFILLTIFEASLRNPRYFLPIIPTFLIIIYAGLEKIYFYAFIRKKSKI